MNIIKDGKVVSTKKKIVNDDGKYLFYLYFTLDRCKGMRVCENVCVWGM